MVDSINRCNSGLARDPRSDKLRPMKVHLARVITILVTCAVAISGARAASQANDRANTALIMGSVVDAVGEQPISVALVTLAGPRGPQEGSAVLTDSRGRFVFSGLPAAAYAIHVTKAGYSAGAYGRRRPGGSEQELVLAADEHVRDARIRLWKNAAVSGSVSDEFGDPVVDLPLRVLRKTIVGGSSQWSFAGGSRTDDRGFYRVSSLTPGSYIVLAPPTPADGGVIVLAAGEERRAVDVRMKPAATCRVTGTTHVTGGSVSATVTLWPEAGPGTIEATFAAATTTSDAAGRFAFQTVPAGKYVIRALKVPSLPARGGPPPGSAAPPTLFAIQPLALDVGGADNVSIDMREGVRVAGTLEFADGQAKPPASALRQIRVVLEPANATPWLPTALTRGPLADDGTFVSNQVPPDRYYLRVAGLPVGWTLKTAMVNGRDVSDAPLLIDRDILGAVITLTNRPAELGGQVVAGSGKADANAAVLIFPADQALWTGYGSSPRRIAMVRVSSAGAYRAVGLPPGEYKVVAIDDEQSGDWPDPGLLKALAPLATAVTLGDGEMRSVSLKTVSVPHR